MKKQSSLSTYVVRPASVVRQKRLNNLLLKTIVRDMQPFSIVDGKGFREFMSALDPSYKLPGRSKLSRELLVDAYYTSVGEIHALMESLESVCLTTDSWTSVTTENYLAVTAHYVDSKFEVGSCLLECIKFGERHTADNLANEILYVTREWKIQKKTCVVTGNAANIVRAVKTAGFKHLPCFAHTLNLVVQQGVVCLKTLQQKVKSVVEYFHRSSVAAAKLASLQLQMYSDKTPLKLKNDVVPTYHMFQRITEIQEPVETALGVLRNPVDGLTPDEWLVLREACTVLKHVDHMTAEISAENFIFSRVICMIC